MHIHFSIPKNLDQFTFSHLENLSKIYEQNIKISFRPHKDLPKTDFEKFIKEYGKFISELILEDCPELIDPDTLKNLSQYCPSISRLSINSNKVMNFGENDLIHFNSLQMLKFIGCTHLKNLPPLPENLKTLSIVDCAALEILPTLPLKLETLEVINSSLTRLPESFPDGLLALDLTGSSDLKTLPNLPLSLLTLILHGCLSLNSLPNLPSDLKILNLFGCMGLKKIESFPRYLHTLNLSMCNGLKNIPQFSDTIVILELRECEFETLPNLPKSLQRLDVSDSKNLRSLPKLPNELLELDASRCQRLERLPGLPDSLQKLHLVYSSADLECLKDRLPMNLQELVLVDCSNLITLGAFPKNIQRINLDRCKNFKYLLSLPSNLQILSLNGCTSLTSLPNLPKGLLELYINECSSDLLLPSDFPDSLLKLEDRIIDFEMTLKPRDANKMMVHLMMDKLFLPNAEFYTGYYHYRTSWIIMKAIDRLYHIILEKSSSSKQERKMVTHLKKSFLPLLEKSRQIYNHAEQLSEWICESIKDLNEGESLFLPVGSNTHSTSLLVTKKNDSAYTLTHYNTGDDIEKWHPRWEQSNRYQTFYIIDDIPLEPLMDRNSWERVFNEQEATSDYIYKAMHDVLGKGGIHLPPSKNEEEYENRQAAGICAVSSIMTILRHQVMLTAKGSPAEKEAIYKSLKIQLFQTFYYDQIQHIDKRISIMMPTILKKFEAEIELKNICENEKMFSKTISDFKELAKKYDKFDMISLLDSTQSKSTWERYSILRKVSTIMCDMIFSQHEIVEKVQTLDSFQLALAKFEHQKIVFSNVESRLQKHASNKDYDSLIKDLIMLSVATPYFTKGIEEAEKRLGQEIPEPYGNPIGTKKFLDNLNQHRKEYHHVVSNFILALIQNGKEDLAKWTESYWSSLSSKS